MVSQQRCEGKIEDLCAAYGVLAKKMRLTTSAMAHENLPT